MDKKPLHITNGSVLTDVLKGLKVEGDILTWQEMLCEGPAIEHIDSDEFLDMRKTFFNDFYDIEIDEKAVKKELNKLSDPEKYSEIILWFEYDLFCHLNMVGVISLINQKKIELPLYLVCSGRVEDGKGLKGLSELTPNQLLEHYKSKVLLKNEDIEMATTIWGIYCGVDHNLLKPFIVKPSSFDYLSSCLKAHLKRFPNSIDGLNTLERNILEIIDKHSITSKHHLLGYALNYQGFYGYGDLQLKRMIDKLEVFYTVSEGSIELSRKGHEALMGHHNFSTEIDHKMVFGGVKKIDFVFSKKKNKLIKSIFNAH
ncbi:DUF1835 domain-containing protein [Tamlana crocina]|uniref:DUF1835 domain-containing protein n=1 Tax=Tamlana crocina TaxID=393006 RepID=A0ABX1DGM4_9FLAO|nr:DUF1835 domain-containing protein [Tamlana crocina]NJX16657.1 DUF1835 domain-containing protein [Tamlana crocina]